MRVPDIGDDEQQPLSHVSTLLYFLNGEVAPVRARNGTANDTDATLISAELARSAANVRDRLQQLRIDADALPLVAAIDAAARQLEQTVRDDLALARKHLRCCSIQLDQKRDRQ
jgi:hypothetical protein